MLAAELGGRDPSSFIAATATLDQVIAQLQNRDPLWVVDEGGQVIGQIQARCLLKWVGQPLPEEISARQIMQTLDSPHPKTPVPKGQDLFNLVDQGIPGYVQRLIWDPSDESLSLVYVSGGVERILGVKRESLERDVYRLTEQFIHPEDQIKLKENLEELLRYGVTRPSLIRLIKADQQVCYLQSYAQVQPLCSGQVVIDCLLVDVTEQQQQNQLKSAIVQAIPDLLVHLDREGRCLQIFNAESAQLLKKDFPPGTRKADVLPPDLAARWSEAINNCLATGQMQTFEQCLEIQGQQQYESVRVVLLDENSVLAVIRDETQSKLTQLALQESEARFRLLAENANDMISTKTPEGVYTYVSPACQTILGYTPEEMIGHSTYEFLHPEDIPNLQKFHQQLLQDNFVRVSHRIRTRNQTYVWVETSARLIRDPQTQNPIEIQAVVRDISERVAYEMSLRLANQNLRYEVEVRNAQLSQALRYEELLRTISDRIRSNLEAAAILQTTVKLLGETLCLQHCQVGTYDPEALTFTAEFSWSKDTQTSVAVGIPCPVNPISVPQLSRGATLSYCASHSLFGRVSLLVCSIQDREQPHRLLKFFRPSEATFSSEEINLAERVAQQCLIGIRQANLFEQAQAQVKKLQELNRIKDDFLHMVSHELRTPLTNMKMALTMLKLTEDPNRREQYFQLLNKAWQQEYNLVNELLELQALESGSLKPHFQPLALGEWLGEIVEPFQERCRSRHQKLVFDFQISLEQLVTDRHLLERIILELLNNACKYTPPHHAIFFKAKASPEAAQVVFEVINTGVTIPEAEQELIFKKFHRLPTLDHFNQGGTGLGLALVKKTVKVLGGQISLHSADQRTCFTVSVPQNPAVS